MAADSADPDVARFPDTRTTLAAREVAAVDQYVRRGRDAGVDGPAADAVAHDDDLLQHEEAGLDQGACITVLRGTRSP